MGGSNGGPLEHCVGCGAPLPPAGPQGRVRCSACGMDQHPGLFHRGGASTPPLPPPTGAGTGWPPGAVPPRVLPPNAVPPRAPRTDMRVFGPGEDMGGIGGYAKAVTHVLTKGVGGGESLYRYNMRFQRPLLILYAVVFVVGLLAALFFGLHLLLPAPSSP